MHMNEIGDRVYKTIEDNWPTLAPVIREEIAAMLNNNKSRDYRDFYFSGVIL